MARLRRPVVRDQDKLAPRFLVSASLVSLVVPSALAYFSSGCNSAAGDPARDASQAYVVRSGDVSLGVDPRIGARIVSLSVGGSENWLAGPDASASNYGSTFWTSPQSAWNWPPPPEIDRSPFVALAEGGKVTFLGSDSQALGVRVMKSFAPGAAGGSIAIQYTIENRAAVERSFAPWEVTRVHPRGVFFFPAGSAAFSSDAGAPLSTRDIAGATWFDYGAASITSSTKYFADGSRGWLAQAAGGLVFVKKFADVPPGDQAPGEAEIELYVSGDRTYVEMEDQGPYRLIAPGASMAWTVRWYLARIPAGVDASVGSASLVAFVDGL